MPAASSHRGSHFWFAPSCAKLARTKPVVTTLGCHVKLPVQAVAKRWFPLWFPWFGSDLHWQPELKNRLLTGGLRRTGIRMEHKQLMSLAEIGVMRFGPFAPGETLTTPKLPACILAYPGGSYQHTSTTNWAFNFGRTLWVSCLWARHRGIRWRRDNLAIRDFGGGGGGWNLAICSKLR